MTGSSSLDAVLTGNPALVEFLKLLLPPVLGALFAWLVGYRLAAKWALWRRRREMYQHTADELYRTYGEFFVAWKLWNYCAAGLTGTAVLSGSDPREPNWDERRWDLLERAAAAEARSEALVLKICSEIPLSRTDLGMVAMFRQRVQNLREVIRDGKPLGWNSSSHADYVQLKDSAAQLAHLISRAPDHSMPTAAAALRQFQYVTSNIHGPTPRQGSAVAAGSSGL